MAGKVKYEMILSDQNLPDGKGTDFLKSLKAESVYDGCPFIMVTTQDEVEFLIEATSFGSDGYIIKPCDENELISAISFAYKKRVN